MPHFKALMGFSSPSLCHATMQGKHSDSNASKARRMEHALLHATTFKQKSDHTSYRAEVSAQGEPLNLPPPTPQLSSFDEAGISCGAFHGACA